MHTRRGGLVVILGLWAAAQPACRREPAAPVPTFVIDARDKKAPEQAPAAAPTAQATASTAPAAASTAPAAASTAPATAPTAPAAPAAPELTPPPATAPSAAADANAEYAAVEISGTIELPPGAQPKERLMVFISSRDCLNDSSPLLRRLPVTDSRAFFAAVLVPQGSALSLCAAAEPAPGKPAHLYGRAGTLPIQKAADQTFRDVKITLAEDTPRAFSTQISR